MTYNATSAKTHEDNMNAIFNTLQYAKRAVKAGYTQEQAEEMATLVNDILVTKDDLKDELDALEAKIQAFHYKMMWTLLGGISSVIGIAQTITYLVGK